MSARASRRLLRADVCADPTTAPAPTATITAVTTETDRRHITLVMLTAAGGYWKISVVQSPPGRWISCGRAPSVCSAKSTKNASSSA